MRKFVNIAVILLLPVLMMCETDGGDANDEQSSELSQSMDTKEAKDLITRFQYAYFEMRLGDFHSMLAPEDQAAKSLRMLEEEFAGLTIGEELMTTYMLSSSDYAVDSTFVVSQDTIVVFGKSEAPLLENVERESMIILRDVGEEEPMGMLLSLLAERLKLRGGYKESVQTQHIAIRKKDKWKVRVGFDNPLP